MPLFQKNILSNQVVKGRADKVMRRSLREARKKIKKSELIDSHDLALYLDIIAGNYTHIKADIENATRVYNYTKIRADKIAETRQLLDFFIQDQVELDRLSQIVGKRAEQAQRIDDFKHQKLANIDLTKLHATFDALSRGDK